VKSDGALLATRLRANSSDKRITKFTNAMVGVDYVSIANGPGILAWKCRIIPVLGMVARLAAAWKPL
jgi:hypothetical protein